MNKIEIEVLWTTTLLLSWLGHTLALEIPAHHSLHDALHHFEVMHVSQLSHHPPPHTSLPHNKDTIHLHFRTLDRDFNLILTPSLSTVHNSLHVTIVSERGEEKIPFPFTHFYNGYLLGSPDSHVIAHLQPRSGLLTASLHTPTEVYYVEPLSRHLPESHDSHMISYKHSHLKFNLTGKSLQHFCGNHDSTSPGKQTSPWKHPTSQTKSIAKDSHNFPSTKLGWGEKQRLKRDLSGDVCTLHLVVTPSFHNQTSNDPDTTALFLIGLISDIDKNIFQEANFPSKLGLFVTNITIYESVTDPSTPEYARERERNSEKLLRKFSQADWSDVCLAHLFTAVRFDDERLGVAYVASRKSNDVGGICSPLVGDDVIGDQETANVGVSSFRNADNRPLLFAEARLVTAHEIGHGWGSEHDPGGNPRCSPPLGRNQGKFLMFPSASDGDQRNNDMLSPCSVDMISNVVQRKGSCFKERSQLEGRCGNYMVDEEGEECDAGALGLVDKDPCCTADCRLRPTTPDGDTVECSDVNNDCCENCRVSNPESMKVCRTNGEGNANCLRSVFCMGEKVCPKNVNLTFELRYVDENSTCGQLCVFVIVA
jgi:disintegrin and metalloproteinase domain-containing protein 17